MAMRATAEAMKPDRRLDDPPEANGAESVNNAESVEFENPSGLQALEYNVLIRPDEVSDVYTFDSGAQLIKAQKTIDDETVAATTGVVIDVSETAFTFEHGAQGVKPGDRVAFARYAGMKIEGVDGVDYLFLKDKSITGVFVDK